MDDVDKIYDVIDKPLSEIKPNYGYVEKYFVAEKILEMSGYLLPKDNQDIIFKMHQHLNGTK